MHGRVRSPLVLAVTIAAAATTLQVVGALPAQALSTGMGGVSTTSTTSTTSITSATSTPKPPKPVDCASCWHPPLDTSWNWVISDVPSAPYLDVAMYDIDGFEAKAADVSALHAAGIKAVCYLSAGTYENFRPDAHRFPKAVIGRSDGWPGERWIDIRELQKRHSVLRSIMDDRLDMCQRKGFDMVELDNVDGYTNKTGFPLTGADQMFFNATLADDVHERGMSVLQKNDNEQIPKLLPYFDGALNEQCNQYHECTTKQNGSFGLDQYVDQGKPVFQAEYKLATSQFCSADNANNFNGVRYDLELDGKRFEPCRS